MSLDTQAAVVDDRVVDTGWFMQRMDGVQFVYMDGRVTDESFKRYLEAVADEVDQRQDAARLAVLYHVPQPSAVGTSRLEAIGRVLKPRHAKLATTTTAYTMATPSPIVRVGLRMLFWIAPPPYPYQVTGSVAEGLQYLARHQPGLDATRLLGLYEQALAEVDAQMGAA